MHGYVKRDAEPVVLKDLRNFPVVAILGPRQCGKSTLVKAMKGRIGALIYLDLESPSDLRKLSDPELFFQANKDTTICLDEIQLRPELFPVLRSIVDRSGRKGQALILGSASRNLIHQGSESLAGRISFIELTPFVTSEVAGLPGYDLLVHWFRGGYPESFLADDDDASNRWRQNFLRTFIERDIPQLWIRITARNLRRLITMLAHSQGQLLNSSKLAASLGVSYHTVRDYIDLFEQAYVVRALPPHEGNLKKRTIKSPKVYIRDSGLLHSLLEIGSFNDLLGHPVFGASWEAFGIEMILSELPDWQGSFYRASTGSEIDLLLAKGKKRIAVELKSSRAPNVTRGFWNALDDLDVTEGWIVAPVDEPYFIKEKVRVGGILDLVRHVKTV